MRSRLSIDETGLHRDAIAWLARLSDPGVTMKDRQAFEQWYERNPAHARVYDKVARVWDEPALDMAAEQVASLDSAIPHRSPQPKERSTRSTWAVAASLSVLVLGGIYVDLPTRLRADSHTEVGERRTIHLPDQSVVTLNTQTAIATTFDSGVRLVRVLKGEAFFNVVHDEQRPFVVESEDTTMRAVGTEFVVRHEPHSDQITVVEGAVEVSARQTPAIVQRLTSGTMVKAEAGRLEQPRSVDPSIASAWRKGLLIVDAAPVTYVLDEIRRYHPGVIVVLNGHLREMRVTGTYRLDEPTSILYHLTKTFPIQTLTLTDRVIVLF